MTVSEEAFDALLLRLYKTVREVPFAQFYDYALRLIKPALDFDAAKWGLGIRDERGPFVCSVHLHELPPGIQLVVGSGDALKITEVTDVKLTQAE